MNRRGTIAFPVTAPMGQDGAGIRLDVQQQVIDRSGMRGGTLGRSDFLP